MRIETFALGVYKLNNAFVTHDLYHFSNPIE